MRRAAAVALGGALLTVVASAFDASPLFVSGVAFMLIGVLVPVWVWCCARGTRLERRLHSDRVVEHEPFEAMIEVRRGLLGLPGAEIEDPLAGEPVPIARTLSVLKGSRSTIVRIVARFPRRGLQALEPPSLIVQDPLGLRRLTCVADTGIQELLVLPRTERVRWAQRGPGERTRAITAVPAHDPLAAVEVDGVRPYRTGTPASRIHWPALARGAGLLERRLQADSHTRPLVVLDARASEADEDLDAAIRAAASLTLDLARRGGCALLLPGEQRPLVVEPELLGWPGAHTRLALIAGGAGAGAPALRPASAAGAVFYVTAHVLERPPAALVAAAGRGSVIVVPARLSARMGGRPCLEVAGCCGFALRSETPRAGDPRRVAREAMS